MQVAAMVGVFAASAVVAPQAPAAKWNVARLIQHATPHASACKVAPRWGPKQIRCASFLVFRREPRLGREAYLIAGCETGHTYNVDPPGYYRGLGQFDPGTWRTLPRWLSRHSPLSPPWAFRAMRYLRLKDGSWAQWPYCSRHAL